MITDIPKSSDFSSAALSFLNLAWETTLGLSLTLDDAKEGASEAVPEADYWKGCQTQLATAVSLVQQAHEFFLKARIADVSPFLLITGTPREWPKGCSKTDTPFADFYALDAQDLVRAHDTVVTRRLPENVKARFDEMRRLRNTIMHTVDKRLCVGIEQVILAILEVSDWAIGSRKWVETRRDYIDESARLLVYNASDDEAIILLAREMMKAVDILKPSDTARFLGLRAKQRRYICPVCAFTCRDCNLQPNLALLQPNTPASENLHCYLCGGDHPVLRRDCSEPGCKGNVLDADDECCLTCYR